jgi:hypothetical protein
MKTLESQIPEYLEEYFEEQGYSVTIPKASARILFKFKDGEVQDVIVKEFKGYPYGKSRLYADGYADIAGNCMKGWEEETTISDVLLEILLLSGQMSREVRRKAIFELSKIEEWRPLLAEKIWNILT